MGCSLKGEGIFIVWTYPFVVELQEEKEMKRLCKKKATLQEEDQQTLYNLLFVPRTAQFDQIIFLKTEFFKIFLLSLIQLLIVLLT